MISRRQFVYTAAAGTILARIPNVLGSTASKYDLIVKGGCVIDPSRKVNAIRDVAIAQGRIAAVDGNIKADATEAECAAAQQIHGIGARYDWRRNAVDLALALMLLAGGLREIVDIKAAFAFLGAQIPYRQQPREPSPAVAILRMSIRDPDFWIFGPLTSLRPGL